MARRNPEKLGGKLLAIRQVFGLSQTELIRKIGFENELSRSEISLYESGRRIPSLIVLRQYAILAGVWVDYLIEDSWELPQQLPSQMNFKREKM